MVPFSTYVVAPNWLRNRQVMISYNNIICLLSGKILSRYLQVLEVLCYCLIGTAGTCDIMKKNFYSFRNMELNLADMLIGIPRLLPSLFKFFLCKNLMNGLSQKLNAHYFIKLYMTDFCIVPYKVYLFLWSSEIQDCHHKFWREKIIL